MENHHRLYLAKKKLFNAFPMKKIKINIVGASKAPTQKMTLPFFYSFIGMQKVYEAAKYFQVSIKELI